MAGRTFRFGMFELDETTGELRKDGRMEPRLREQSLQILLSLLERPQDVVTRDELRQRLWPSDTFVDFDHGLNTAVNQLRAALGDSAANPRFIQTLPKRGYRFIAPVEPASVTTSVIDSPVPVVGQTQLVESAEEDHRSILSEARDLPPASRSLVRLLFGLIQLMYLGFYVTALARLTELEQVIAGAGHLAPLLWVAIIVTAAMGIPIRLYLAAAVSFNYMGLRGKFLKLFPFVFPLDEMWALAPFLMVAQIGFGLAIAAAAALLYLPFAQRSLLLMEKSAAQNESAQR